MRSCLTGLARRVLTEVSDAELLQRYATAHCDEAFAQLVARYARLVWGQCRHLLANEADAEDAFQATFLVLARSVNKLRPGAPLGPWLHGTAYRVCMRARRTISRRVRGERAAASVRADHLQPVADSVWDAAYAALCEEVHQLPEAQRAAFVLCCLDGRTQVDAATVLGHKIGTFAAHLKRAKQTLLVRLARRGFGAGAVALSTVAASNGAASPALIGRTLSLLGSGAPVPRTILVLTQGVTSMTGVRLKVLVTAILVGGGLSLSAVGGLFNTASGQPAPTPGNSTPVPTDPNFQGGVQFTQPATNGDPEVQKARAEYEKARRALELAAEDLKRKQSEAELRAAQRAAEDRRREREEARAAEKPAGKFLFEPVPKNGFTPQEFEKKIAEHEARGWYFAGEATIRENQVAERVLVFRNTVKAPPPGKPNDFGTPGGVPRTR
jgi:RNA polymerase sigma factor (sigma-70 family)